MKKFCFLALLACFFNSHSSAQNSETIYQLFQKYFLSLPYNKRVDDWINEIADNKIVTIDTLHKKDTASNIFLEGHINNWPLFEKLDSVKFAVGRRVTYSKFGINNNMVTSPLDTSLFFQEIFYFPSEGIDGKTWKEIYKPFLNDFKKLLNASYPTGGFRQGELIWFTTTSGIPFGGPLVSVDYGKLEKRKLYFINLVLYFRAQSVE